MEHTHIRMKALEYDKVDVLKVNAELEGKMNHLQSDVEGLIKERNALKLRLNDTLDEVETLKEKLRTQTSE